MSSGRIDDTSDEGPVSVITTSGDNAWFRTCIMPDDLFPLLLMLGNGLEGDVRFVGNDADAVEMSRGLIIGTGACRPMEPPTDAPLYQLGDECYRQHDDGRAFLNPTPTGDVVHRRAQRASPEFLALKARLVKPMDDVVNPLDGEWVIEDFALAAVSGEHVALDRPPTYRSGRDRHRLYEGARVVVLPFSLPSGAGALYVVLREKWKDRLIVWAGAERSMQVHALVARLNRDIETTWRSWRASPGFE